MKRYIIVLMMFLQKVSFCNSIRKNPRFFSTYRRKKIGIAVTSLIILFNFGIFSQSENAILTNCKEDLLMFCSTIRSGNLQKIQCLLENESDLSGVCKDTLKSSLNKMKESGSNECKKDVQEYCRWVIPGGGRILKCLLKNESKLSDGCKKKMREL